jgi:DNA-binding PadR family transcriptional regulator
MPADPKTTLPLSPVALYVLLALADGERHGYAIIKEIEAASGGDIRVLPGTMYRVIKQLVDDRWIIEVEPYGGETDERRRYYRLTPWGRKVAQAEVERMATVLRMARARQLLPASIRI